RFGATFVDRVVDPYGVGDRRQRGERLLRFRLGKSPLTWSEAIGKSGGLVPLPPDAADIIDVEAAVVGMNLSGEAVTRCAVGQNRFERILVCVPTKAGYGTPMQLVHQQIGGGIEARGDEENCLHHRAVLLVHGQRSVRMVMAMMPQT